MKEDDFAGVLKKIAEYAAAYRSSVAERPHRPDLGMRKCARGSTDQRRSKAWALQRSSMN